MLMGCLLDTPSGKQRLYMDRGSSHTGAPRLSERAIAAGRSDGPLGVG